VSQLTNIIDDLKHYYPTLWEPGIPTNVNLYLQFISHMCPALSHIQ